MTAGASAPPLRRSVLFAVAVVLTYVVVGAVAGVVWEWLWTPPTQVVAQHQLFYSDYGSLRAVFTGTGLYALVSAVASALVALAAGLLTRRHELLVLAAVVLGSVAAAYTMHAVGVALGPPDPAPLAKTAADGTHFSARLVVNGKSPYLVWPMVSLFVIALVFFALPAVRSRHRADPDSSPADTPAEQDSGLADTSAGPAADGATEGTGAAGRSTGDLPPDR